MDREEKKREEKRREEKRREEKRREEKRREEKRREEVLELIPQACVTLDKTCHLSPLHLSEDSSTSQSC